MGVSISLLRFGLIVITISSLFSGLFNHAGDTALVVLPAGWPLIGGNITLESTVAGANNGVQLIMLLAIFSTFSAAVSPAELVRLFPAVLRDLGLVVLIAMTYIPETRAHLGRIREAQAIRGHAISGMRDLRPLVIPLLVGGLERSFGIAEATVARGYGAAQDSSHRGWHRLVSLIGLALLMLGWLLRIWRQGMGFGLMLIGVLVLGWLWREGRQMSRRTRYRMRPWRWADTVTVSLLSTAVLALWLPLPSLDRESLLFLPFPRLAWPGFQLWIGVLMLAPALPTLLARD